MTNLIAWIIVGALAGWIGSMIMKTDAEMGSVANIVVGIIGALLGGFVVNTLFGAQVDANGFNIWSILTAILGAMIVIWAWKLFQGRKAV